MPAQKFQGHRTGFVSIHTVCFKVSHIEEVNEFIFKVKRSGLSRVFRQRIVRTDVFTRIRRGNHLDRFIGGLRHCREVVLCAFIFRGKHLLQGCGLAFSPRHTSAPSKWSLSVMSISGCIACCTAGCMAACCICCCSSICCLISVFTFPAPGNPLSSR